MKNQMEMEKEVQYDKAKHLMSKMVGLYRLFVEQGAGVHTGIIRVSDTGDKSKRKDWLIFRELMFEELYDHILSKMEEIISNSKKETSSIEYPIFRRVRKDNPVFPKQSVAVRLGFVFEHALNRFAQYKGDPISPELIETINDYFGYKPDVDALVETDGCVHCYEIKCNLNLDTGKVRDLTKNVSMMDVAIKKHYKDGRKNSVGIVTPRYATEEEIPELKAELEAIRIEYIMGWQEFFNMFDVYVSRRMWRTLQEEIGERINTVYNSLVN